MTFIKSDLPSLIFEKTGLSYNEELYYLINPQNKNMLISYPDGHSKTSLQGTINHSINFWRELCILSNFKLTFNKNLSLIQIHEIVDNIELIALDAYDGEGHIFWERTNLL